MDVCDTMSRRAFQIRQRLWRRRIERPHTTRTETRDLFKYYVIVSVIEEG